MVAFRDKPIRTKLMVVIMLIATTTLLAAFAVFAVLDSLVFRHEMVDDMTGMAEIISVNSTAALAFDDPAAAAEVLASLQDRHHIQAAYIYDHNGAVFAQYPSATSAEAVDGPAPDWIGHRFTLRRLELSHPITIENRSIGQLYVQANLSPVYARLRQQARIACLVILLATGVAFGMTSLLQRIISTPIHSLAFTVRTVSESKDYSLRSTPYGADEIGTLIGAFNEMLAEIQRRDRALSRSEEHFRALIEHGSDLITLLDEEGAVLYASPSLCRGAAMEASEVVGTSFLEWVHPEDCDRVRSLLQDSTETEETVRTVEYRYRLPEGRWVVLESIVNNLRDAAAVGGIVVNSRDVTERKAAEEQLAAFARSLEQSNRELQDFAYVASHDLQEPLRKIQAFGDRLKTKCGDTLTDQGGDYLDRILNAADRMQNLIVSLLDFSRVTTKAQPFVEVDLERVAREVLNDLEIGIEQVGAKITVRDLPSIEADPTQMRQLIQNLVGNALKFHREDCAPEIQISGEFLPSPAQTVPGCNGARCLLRVQDNGIGFDPKYQNRIFGIFQRLHGRGEYEGTGVGLSICRKIADRHGGEIGVISAAGKGATFEVALPIHQDQKGTTA